LRLLAGRFGYFFEQDEISLGTGVAALVEGQVGYLYHYGPQVGYYRLAQALVLLTGGSVAAVPYVLTTLSAIAGAALPALMLRAFRRELSIRQRVLAAAILACSPIVWVSAQYGNSAVVSAALVMAAVTVLSNRPDRRGIAAGLALYGAAGLVRGDAILAAPAVAWLAWRATRSAAEARGLAYLCVIGGGAALGALFLLDPGMADLGGDVRSHVTDVIETRFWEHLTWAISPFVLGFALWGLFDIVDRKLEIWRLLVVWLLPVFAFYFGSATTPRYFLLAAAPLAVLAAFGLERMASGASDAHRTRAWIAVGALAFAHLFVGLGRFHASSWGEIFTAPTYDTHDGPMPTGALIYQGFHGGPGVLGHSLRAGAWGGRSFAANGMRPQLARLQEPEAPSRVVALIDGWNGHALHYHLIEAGAELLERSPGDEWLAPHRYQVGNTEVITLGIAGGSLDALAEFPFEGGDEIWHIVSGNDALSWDVIVPLIPGHLRPALHAASAESSVHVYQTGGTP